MPNRGRVAVGKEAVRRRRSLHLLYQSAWSCDGGGRLERCCQREEGLAVSGRMYWQAGPEMNCPHLETRSFPCWIRRWIGWHPKKQARHHRSPWTPGRRTVPGADDSQPPTDRSGRTDLSGPCPWERLLLSSSLRLSLSLSLKTAYTKRWE